MHFYQVILFITGGSIWVEILRDGEQDGPDMDCENLRTARMLCRQQCKRLDLTSYEERITRKAMRGASNG